MANSFSQDLNDEDVSISSIKISELPTLTSLPDDAYFVVESVHSATSASYKVPYKDFKLLAFQQLSSQLSLGLMAYEDDGSFALAAHSHDYSNFWFYPSYGPQSANPKYQPILSCYKYGQFNVSAYSPGPSPENRTVSSIGVYAPKLSSILIDETLLYSPLSVGDIQMLAITGCSFKQYLTDYRGYKLKAYNANGLNNIDIADKSFDGYVIPNGTTFTCKSNEFKDACIIYAGNANATQFTVPRLSSFFRGNIDNSNDDAIKFIPYHNAMSAHTHNLLPISESGNIYQIKDQKKLTCKLGSFSIATSQCVRKQYDVGKTYDKRFLHAGSGDKSDKILSLNLKKVYISGQLNNIEISAAGEDREQCPNYVTIPVLLYIGKRGT